MKNDKHLIHTEKKRGGYRSNKISVQPLKKDLIWIILGVPLFKAAAARFNRSAAGPAHGAFFRLKVIHFHLKE